MPTPTSSPSRCPSCQSPVLDTAITCPTCGDFLPISSSALNVGTLLRSGSYRIDGVLGQGGFGITYRAWDTGLSSGVAIKEHFPEGDVIRGVGATLRPSSPQSMIQFEASKKDAFREAQILYQLHHPSIVRVLAAWEENNTVYMAMELLEGETLNQRLASGVLSEVQAVATLRSLLRALEQVHTAGVLHRDLKPDNIMLTAKYGPVIIDFGNARSYSIQGTTRFSKVIATPAYAAPEQFISQAQFGPYTDFYGLAATFYHLLSGQFPTPALERSMGVVQTPLAHLRPDLSPALLESLEAALSLKVNERPPTAAAWLNLLPNPTGQPSSQTAGHPTGQSGQTRTVNIPNIPNTPNTPSNKSNTPTVQVPNSRQNSNSSARGNGNGANGTNKVWVPVLGGVLGLAALAGGFFILKPAKTSTSTATSSATVPVASPTKLPSSAPNSANSTSSASSTNSTKAPSSARSTPIPPSPVRTILPLPSKTPQASTPPKTTPQTFTSNTSSIPNNQPFTPNQVEIKVNRLNVRSGPSTGAQPLQDSSGQALQLALGQQVQVNQTQNGFMQIQAGGRWGWIANRFTVPLNPRVADSQLQQLEQAARTGGKLTLSRGVYFLPSTLQISAPLELIGQGVDQTILVSSSASPTLRYGGSGSLRLSNLTVAHQGFAPAAVLEVQANFLELSGVRVLGGRDNAQNKPGDGLEGDGLVVLGNTQATLEGSEFLGNGWRGLHALGNAQVTARNSAFDSNFGSGALFEGNSGGNISNSSAHFNDLSGFKVVDSATLELSNSKLSNNKNALFLADSAQATLSQNTCQGNTAGDLEQQGGRLSDRANACALTPPIQQILSAPPQVAPERPPASAQNNLQNSVTNTLSSVRNATLNYALGVPRGWIHSSSSGQSGTSRKDTWTDPSNRFAKVLVEVGPTFSGDALAGWQSLDLDMRGKYGSNYQMLDLADHSSSALGQFARWEFLLQKNGQTLHKIDLSFGRGSWGYAVLVQAPDGQWNTYGPVFDQVLSSFSFLN